MDIVPVTSENRNAILSLSVKSSQLGFIETTAQCLEEADSEPRWRPVGLYEAGQLVGFAMYGAFSNEGPRVWLDRLLIDQHFQSRGYGHKALELLIEKIRAEYNCNTIYLSLYEDNHAALSIYQQYGFYLTGELDTKGEKIMCLNLA